MFLQDLFTTNFWTVRDFHIKELRPIHIKHLKSIHTKHLGPIHTKHLGPIQNIHLEQIHTKHLGPIHTKHLGPIHAKQYDPIDTKQLGPIYIKECNFRPDWANLFFFLCFHWLPFGWTNEHDFTSPLCSELTLKEDCVHVRFRSV